MSYIRALTRYLTVAYADIFDYPLTDSEIRRWSIHSTGTYSIRVKHAPLIVKDRGMYVLPGRVALITRRKGREQISAKKWEIARKTASWLQHVPTIRMVGVTGGLSMDNVDTKDDIDLFIVTGRRTLWLSRLLAVLCFDVIGVRRKPNQTIVQDKVCLNMFVQEDALMVPDQEQDLFTAHEVLQMVPLWEKGPIYRKFLEANVWVKDFLPNAWKEKTKDRKQSVSRVKENRFLFFIFSFLCTFLEPLARVFQLWYMRKKRTNEVILNGMLRFHPRDARDWIKRALVKRLSPHNIPLDNIFYGG